MSRMAMDLERQVNELKLKNRQENSVEKTPAERAKAYRARKKAPKATTSRKAKTNAKRLTLDDLDALTPLTLAENGVSGGEKNQYINLSFLAGDGSTYVIRLYPVGFGKKNNVKKVRDVLVVWLRQLTV